MLSIKHLFKIKNALLLLILLLICGCSPIGKYRTEATSWERDIRNFEHLDSVERYSKDAILFTGSSSIRLWNTIGQDMSPYEVIQRGFGGAKWSDYVFYTKRIVYPHPIKAIVFYIGNDIVGSPVDKKPGKVAKLFQYVVKDIRSKYPETPIFYIQVFPTDSRKVAWPKIQQGNEKVEKISNKLHKVYYIRMSDYLVNSDGTANDSLFQSDHLHLNKAGYQVWTKVIKDALSKVKD